MFKRLTGTLTDLTWPDTDIKFHTSNGTTESWRLSLWEEDCNGHRGSDVFPFDLTDAGSSFKVDIYMLFALFFFFQFLVFFF